MDKKVTSSKWNDFAANLALQPGLHSVEVSYTNDFESTAGQACNRNVAVDKVTLQ